MRWNAKLVNEEAKRYRNWGRWGKDDQIGTLNFITNGMVAEASRLVKKGRVFSLSIPFSSEGPQRPGGTRWNPIHIMLRTGTDSYVTDIPRSTDDAIIMPLQCATQWDGLAHAIGLDRKIYNGWDASVVTGAGATKNGIEHLRSKVVGRGILLDIARYLGKSALEPGFRIMPDTLDACAEAEGVRIRRGDFIIFRTGHMEKYLKQGDWGDYAGGDAPGLSIETAGWAYRREIVGLASDTYAVEVFPSQAKDCHAPWHRIVISSMGLLVGEIFYLKELAEECSKDDVYEFFFVAPVLPVTGAVGSPVNPQAIK